MKAYHITRTSNLSGIFKEGIRPSVSGADGPGVYAWIGTLRDAVKNADLMMFNGTELSEEQQQAKMNMFTVLELTLPFELEDPDIFDRWINCYWDDYIVIRDAVPSDSVSDVGNFGELSKGFACNKAQSILFGTDDCNK